MLLEGYVAQGRGTVRRYTTYYFYLYFFMYHFDITHRTPIHTIAAFH